jgi:hypothetical protein
MRKPRGYWTAEKCKEDAAHYTSRAAWKLGNESSYASAKLKGIIDQCCEHMPEIKKPRGYWTVERCTEMALKHKRRSDWARAHPTSYLSATFLQVLDECCIHMS